MQHYWRYLFIITLILPPLAQASPCESNSAIYCGCEDPGEPWELHFQNCGEPKCNNQGGCGWRCRIIIPPNRPKRGITFKWYLTGCGTEISNTETCCDNPADNPDQYGDMILDCVLETNYCTVDCSEGSCFWSYDGQLIEQSCSPLQQSS